MSIVIETFIMCDGGCGYAHGVDDRSKTGKQQRESAKRDGWLFIKGRDYCPDCGVRRKTGLRVG